MGKKSLIINGQEIEVTDEQLKEFKEKAANSKMVNDLSKRNSTSNEVGFGSIVEYKHNGETTRGKVTGFNKSNNKFRVALASGAGRAGVFYSSTDYREVAKTDIVRIVPEGGVIPLKRPNNG